MSWFSRFSPVPSFPEYTGPYKVGSIDVELPVSDLESPTPTPNPDISTVAFRVFYPCEPSSHERSIRWIPSPQRGYVGAYSRFLGANSAFAEFFSYVPQLFYYITIPVHRNARLLQAPTRSQRWPVMMFSHGLGGSRNAYSHIAGSLSSHGVVVIAPDHRDGSAPISYIRATEKAKATTAEYRKISHQPSPEVYAARDEQLKIRMWELGLIHDALLRIDKGEPVKNLDPNSTSSHGKDSNDVLSMFSHQLEVHKPGAITWAGHSFGAATTVQFVKSVFWRPSLSEKSKHIPLFTAPPSSSIAQQITPSSPVMLLDLWCLPLRSPSTRWLWEKPMPCYAPSGPGGTVLLAVLSEAFFKWRGNLQDTKRALSENPASDSPSHKKPGPRIFYPATSAHLSQSDFGVLFPWVTKRVFNAQEPERTLRLNVRAMLQVMRDAGIEVADTSRIDMEVPELKDGEVRPAHLGKGQDWKILATDDGVRGWIAVNIDDRAPNGHVENDKRKGPADAVVEGEVLGEVRDQKM